MNDVLNYLTSSEFFGTVVILALYLVCNHMITKAYEKFIRERMKQADNRMADISHLLYTLIRGALFIVTVITILHANGIKIATLAAFLSILSAVIGLALQDMLRDVVNGMHLSQDNYFSIGDTIIYGDKTGVVVGMTSRSVKILDIYTGDTHIIANRMIDNVTRRSRQNDIDLGLSYEDDFSRINEVMRSICEHISSVDGIDNCIYKGINEYCESCIIYKIRFFCQPDSAPEMRRSALRIIQQDLADNGIRIPYPQLDVHHPK